MLFGRPALLALRAALLLVVLTATLPAQAQSARNYGSPYSRLGLGERLSFSSSQAEMMGGASVAVRSLTYNNLENPALWSDLGLTQLSVAAQIEGVESENAAGEQAQLSSGSLAGLQFGVPLLTNRLGLTLAFRPFTRVNYLAVRDGEATDPGAPDTPIPYRVNFEGDGGLQQARLGLGYRLGPAFAVGASVDVLFGTIDHLQRTEFESTAINETRSVQSTDLSGVSGTVGALFSTTGLLGEEDALSLGASLTLPTRLSGERVRTLGFSLDRDTLGTPTTGDVTIPLQLAAGFSYVPDARWVLAADVRYEPWSSFDSDFAFGGFAPDGEDDLRDRFRVGGGFQFLPAGNDRSRAYFARTAYRLGGYYDQSYFNATGLGADGAPAGPGESVSTLALTGGLSLPAVLPTARFDLGFEVGTRGTTDRGLVRDLFFKVSATINFGERWFRERRLG
jgi:hypothetical protein